MSTGTTSRPNSATAARLSRAERDAATVADLQPIKRVAGLVYDPTKPPNPYLIHEAYGDEQFPRWLGLLSLVRLKEVEEYWVAPRSGGAKPTSRASKAALINFIVTQVTGKAPPASATPATSTGRRQGDARTASRTGGAKKAPQPSVADFTPVKRVPGLEYDATRPPNPYLLYEAYGDKQIAPFLGLLSRDRLNEVSQYWVEQRNPGSKPKNRGSKASVIDYILQHVKTDQ